MQKKHSGLHLSACIITFDSNFYSRNWFYIMAKLFCISDAHLGAQEPELEQLKKEKLTSFLNYVLQEDGELIINGDLFDFWFEYRHAVPRQHFQILAQLSNFVNTGKKIHYIAGNHDFWLDSFLEDQVGLILHRDEYELEFDGKKYYIRHGDGLLKKDYLYRGLKKVLRNPVNIFLYRLLHPDFGIPLALHFSHQSRTAAKKQTDYSDSDYREFAFNKIDKGYDFVLLGHTHWPAKAKHLDGWYLNSGHWMGPFTFIVVENAVPKVLQWDGEKSMEIELALPPGNI